MAPVDAQGPLTIERCDFLGNSLNSGGGVVVVLGMSTLTVQILDCSITNNGVIGDGGKFLQHFAENCSAWSWISVVCFLFFCLLCFCLFCNSGMIFAVSINGARPIVIGSGIDISKNSFTGFGAGVEIISAVQHLFINCDIIGQTRALPGLFVFM